MKKSFEKREEVMVEGWVVEEKVGAHVKRRKKCVMSKNGLG